MKAAILSMDIEDWYHLDYFRGVNCDHSHSSLDAITAYQEILAQHALHSSFFVLGELVEANRNLLLELVADGHDVGVHGWDHTRPLTMSVDEFTQDLRRSKATLEDAIGVTVQGYRAPCFSLDRQRLDIVREVGFGFDSSYIPFVAHPLYGKIDMAGFSIPFPGIYRDNDFFEFELSTLSMAGKNIPISGGGYLRIFPWLLMRALVRSYLKDHELYTLYIHPFELSMQRTVSLPKEVRWATSLRFNLGRRTTREKLSKLILLLKSNGFRFTTFAELRKELMQKGVSNAQ